MVALWAPGFLQDHLWGAKKCLISEVLEYFVESVPERSSSLNMFPGKMQSKHSLGGLI